MQGPLQESISFAPREIVRGMVKQIVYTNEENAYTVLRLDVEEGPSPVTAVGNFLNIQLGEELQLQGEWMLHPQYGRQFKATHYARNQPSTLKGIRRYLSSMVEGIGPELARRLVAYFGLETLRIIEEESHRLVEVKGIAKARVGQIRDAWAKHQALQEIMVFLQGYQVTPHQALRIFRQYGNDTIAMVRDNPYRLATDIHGFGFRTADNIAISLGIPQDSAIRAKAALLFYLEQSSRQGHVFLPRSILFQEMAPQFGILPERLEEAIIELDMAGEIVLEPFEEDMAIFLRKLAACERGTARRVRGLIGEMAPQLPRGFEAALATFEREADLKLAKAQRRAVEMAVRTPFSIITGGPGTGKTTIVRAICHWAELQGWTLKLAAPTGRAAKRMEEACGVPASTLHRLLEFSPHEMRFQRNGDRALDCELLVVDEASMLDIYLFYAVIRALPHGARLLLVGDADQLPSVGPGNVLRDLLDSDVVPKVRLDQIFRQKESGLIVENAHRINQGQKPILPVPRPQELYDFYFIPAKQRNVPRRGSRRSQEQARALWVADTIVEVVTRRIPKRFGLDPHRDIQVISPMHRGEAGVQFLNQKLQEALNGKQPSLQAGALRFHVGDRVIQTRNDYDKDVFNGDIGKVVDLDRENVQLSVCFDDDRVLTYDRAELDDLSLAFAISVHKSQGSEFSAVVVPMLYQHYIMLQRNLLYTALTRGKKLVVILGTEEALEYAVSNDQIRRRFSRLSWRLAEQEGVAAAARALRSDRPHA